MSYTLAFKHYIYIYTHVIYPDLVLKSTVKTIETMAVGMPEKRKTSSPHRVGVSAFRLHTETESGPLRLAGSQGWST